MSLPVEPLNAGMDGWECLRRRANDPRTAKILVIVVSAVSPYSLEGVQAVLRKPVNPEELVDAVRRRRTQAVSAGEMS